MTEKEKGGQKINKLKEKFQKEEDTEAELKIYVKKERKKVANEKEKQWYEELRQNRTEKDVDRAVGQTESKVTPGKSLPRSGNERGTVLLKSVRGPLKRTGVPKATLFQEKR